MSEPSPEASKHSHHLTLHLAHQEARSRILEDTYNACLPCPSPMHKRKQLPRSRPSHPPTCTLIHSAVHSATTVVPTQTSKNSKLQATYQHESWQAMGAKHPATRRTTEAIQAEHKIISYSSHRQGCSRVHLMLRSSRAE